METGATPILGARDPPQPTKTAHLGEGQAPAQPGWARWAFLQIICILLAVAFAWGLWRAGYDLGFVAPTTGALATLCLCLWMLELLRRGHGGDPAVAARERRRFGLIAWAMSLVLASLVAVQVASAASSMALIVALWVLGGLAMVLAICLLFASRRGDTRADDAARSPEKGLHELSPEQRV